MSKVSLRDITHENWRTCVQLTVASDQENFVATNAVSLAQAAYETNWNPKAVHVGKEIVGFVMYGIEFYQGKNVWDIIRVMIDKNHQRKGYASAAIQQLLDLLRAEDPTILDVYISFIPDNQAARLLYSKVGFHEVGRTPNGEEILMYMSLA